MDAYSHARLGGRQVGYLRMRFTLKQVKTATDSSVKRFACTSKTWAIISNPMTLLNPQSTSLTPICNAENQTRKSQFSIASLQRMAIQVDSRT